MEIADLYVFSSLQRPKGNVKTGLDSSRLGVEWIDLNSEVHEEIITNMAIISGATGPHFSDAELRCHGTNCNLADRTKGCGVNGCQQSLIDALEAFRELVGKPVLLTDAFRCAIHNAQVGGVGKSEHMEGLAADIRVEGMTAGELEAIARKIPAIRGIGRADHQQYLHVDVRNALTLARWCYNLDGRVIPWYPTPESVGPVNA